MRISQVFGLLILVVAIVFQCLPDRALLPMTRARADGQSQSASAETLSAPAKESQGRSRKFRFHYRFDVSGLVPNDPVRIWLPVPQSNGYQKVVALPHNLTAESTLHTEPKYGNRILYLEVVAPENGLLSLDVPYQVERREVRALKSGGEVGVAQQIDEFQRNLFLKPNAKVPIDGKPLELLNKLKLSDDAYQLASQLYEVVDKHVSYNKVGSGWGNGDVLWVCDSRRGNCTDFHSLFISLARSQGIPSRFEIGFPIPTAAEQGPVGGYHCWAFFFVPNRGWVPVDISEADKHPSMKDYYFGNLTPDRVAFSVGRDIELVPRSEQRSLNYFVYPHVEVSGKPVPKEQIELRFAYCDIP